MAHTIGKIWGFPLEILFKFLIEKHPFTRIHPKTEKMTLRSNNPNIHNLVGLDWYNFLKKPHVIHIYLEIQVFCFLHSVIYPFPTARTLTNPPTTSPYPEVFELCKCVSPRAWDTASLAPGLKQRALYKYTDRSMCFRVDQATRPPEVMSVDFTRNSTSPL